MMENENNLSPLVLDENTDVKIVVITRTPGLSTDQKRQIAQGIHRTLAEMKPRVQESGVEAEVRFLTQMEVEDDGVDGEHDG